jgi:hypothetical protein
MGRWTSALKMEQSALIEETPDNTDIITVLTLAQSYNWGIAVIVSGGWRETDDGERVLIFGEVIGGDETHWRAFCDRASDAQLREATALLLSLAEAA